MTAQLSLNDTRPQNLSLERAAIELGPSELAMSSGTLASNRSVVLANFSGRISTSQPLEASGSLEGWSAGATRFSGDRKVEGEIDSEKFSAVTGSPNRLALSSVSGVLGIDDTQTRLSNSRDVVISDFNGRINISSQDDTLGLNGSASAIRAGSLSYD